jgi:membrane-associated phospholipid phosphatase
VATAIARNKSCPRWLKVASYSAAGLVSFSRVAANRHFASDVFLGSFMGVLIGDYVSSRHR